MLAGVQGLGLTVFGDVAHKMNNVVAVEIPDGVAGDAARGALLNDFGIEIGTSFGPLHGRVWRIGTMGYNARKDAVLHDPRRARGGAAPLRRAVPVGGGVDAALGIYASAATERMRTRLPELSTRRLRGGGATRDGALRRARARHRDARRDRARLPLARARARQPPRRASGCARSA